MYEKTGDSSRKWYGEIYIPSSTIVVDNKKIPETMSESEKIKNITNGKGILEKGYLLITFEKIETTAESIESYLKYSVLRNVEGEITSPEMPSVIVQEKEEKDKIILPNGKEIKNLPENFKNTDAPIIIYDVSLRANNDYESSGTH